MVDSNYFRPHFTVVPVTLLSAQAALARFFLAKSCHHHVLKHLSLTFRLCLDLVREHLSLTFRRAPSSRRSRSEHFSAWACVTEIHVPLASICPSNSGFAHSFTRAPSFRPSSNSRPGLVRRETCQKFRNPAIFSFLHFASFLALRALCFLFLLDLVSSLHFVA